MVLGGVWVMAERASKVPNFWAWCWMLAHAGRRMP